MKGVGPIFRDLRRRGVLQATAVYIVSAWVILQVAGTLFPGAGIPGSGPGPMVLHWPSAQDTFLNLLYRERKAIPL